MASKTEVQSAHRQIHRWVVLLYGSEILGGIVAIVFDAKTNIRGRSDSRENADNPCLGQVISSSKSGDYPPNWRAILHECGSPKAMIQAGEGWFAHNPWQNLTRSTRNVISQTALSAPMNHALRVASAFLRPISSHGKMEDDQ